MEEKKLLRYIQGKATQKEREDVTRWLNQPGAREELDKIVERYLEDSSWEGTDETDYQRLLTGIHKKIQKGEETGRNESWYPKGLLKIAASLLFFGLGIFYVMDGFRSGSRDTGVVVEEASLIAKETGVGEKLTLTFPDGTKATLNSLSRISFSSTYGKSDRVVRLVGEAFFEIAPDEKRPFRLETGPVTTTALGTAFNATSRDDRVEIHLTEGRVSVKNPMQEVILNPGEMAAVNDRIEVGLFDEGQVTAWKEGRITFQKKSITEILSLLEKWYGVSITDKSSLDKKRTVTGTFNNENLADILNGLSFSVGFVYQIDDKNVQIQ